MYILPGIASILDAIELLWLTRLGDGVVWIKAMDFGVLFSVC